MKKNVPKKKNEKKEIVQELLTSVRMKKVEIIRSCKANDEYVPKHVNKYDAPHPMSRDYRQRNRKQ